MIFLRRFISSSLQCARVCVCCVCLRNCERDIQIDSSRKWSLLLLLSLPNILRSPILFFFPLYNALVYLFQCYSTRHSKDKQTHTHRHKRSKKWWILIEKKKPFCFCFFMFSFCFHSIFLKKLNF